MSEQKENLQLYNKLRSVPPEAQKKITGGRLNGMTDISPMWRIKILTETFGVCGFGWKYEIVEKRLEHGAKDQISAFVSINLYVKVDDKWSEKIPGTGGSAFVSAEKAGLYQSDECFKMALTDAISVSCKALGVGADIYFEKDKSKYDSPPEDKNKEPKKPSPLEEEKKMRMAIVASAKKKIGVDSNLLTKDFTPKEKEAFFAILKNDFGVENINKVSGEALKIAYQKIGK